MPKLFIRCNEVEHLSPNSDPHRVYRVDMEVWMDEGHAKQLQADLNKLYPEEVENETL